MNELNSLQSMGLTLPSPAYLMGALLFGIVGYVAFRRGRTSKRARLVWTGVALAFGIAGCSTAPTNVLKPPLVQSRLSPEQANDVTLMAIGLVGTPYRYGGNTPVSGFDCSGLIGYVYKARAGVVPPRSVSALVGWGSPVPADEVRTGDLAIFLQGGSATHAGIYVGEGRFVHAPSTGGEVRLDQLKSKYWAMQQVAFRRP
jgi:cell wall-associated NlpC family hydrolase